MPRKSKTTYRKKTLDGMKKVDDAVLMGARPDDIIVPVMGPTGVGKSTFINTAVGEVVTPVGHDLMSCTTKIQYAFCPCPGDPSRRLVLVDTPGFDNTFLSDTEILRRIAVWLASSYGVDMKLAGVLYLYDICQARMLSTSRRNLDMFRRLCGENAEMNVILVTTKWGEVNKDVGERREQQLKSSFWKDMVAYGSQAVQFDGSHASAWNVMQPILTNKATAAVQMIPETDAGNTLQAVKGVKERVGDVDEQRQKLKEIEKALRELLKQVDELKVLLG
ncbi:P-loop containing nucleoside triphosphate hydrolase protein [Suillus paluster]|uniref:P-loop containing nucleoside triphosphate hydrolase protein n=1 Tax=Suillus paluster TaxID=48578 RepID=UPI001B860B91|nr:P-loop containing nucleoside triphosphate hydrolase protein [Suillus paluster]KAG1740794.1 P-loop containing nucleoside triphosphate hydrolase protein [Suillus paluster]